MAPIWLKAVPWSTILSNTPVILDAAKKLVALVKKRGSHASGTAAGAEEALPDLTSLSARVQELDRRQQQAAELLRSLAESNAQLAQAAEALRRRTTANFMLTVIALACVAAIGLWLLLR